MMIVYDKASHWLIFNYSHEGSVLTLINKQLWIIGGKKEIWTISLIEAIFFSSIQLQLSETTLDFESEGDKGH